MRERGNMLRSGVEIQLRPAGSQDVKAVTEILLRTRLELMPYAPMPHAPESALIWVAQHLIPSGAVTVACEGEYLVGLVARRDEGDICWIDHLYVMPERLHQGIGSRLLRHAFQDVRGPVRLYCFQPNHSARFFYESNGFRAIEYGDGSGNEEGCPDVLYERPAVG